MIQKKYAYSGGPGTFRISYFVPAGEGNFDFQEITLLISGELWDHDESTSDDLVASFTDNIWTPSYGLLSTGKYYTPTCKQSPEKSTSEALHTSWSYCVRFYDADKP
jgi:hypothetical protein